MTMALRLLFVLLAIANVGHAENVRIVSGRVLDQSGKPVARADISFFWRANGSPKDKNGKAYDLSSLEAQRIYWGNVGKMEPFWENPVPAKTGTDGRFLMKVHSRFHAVMAMDPNRSHGGIVILPKGSEKFDVEIRLAPLVRVKCALEGPRARQRPRWSCITALLPDDPTQPLDTTRLVMCGSFDARFEMSLPPGRYLLHGYTFNQDEIAELIPDKEILLTGKTSEVDVGTLHLAPFRLKVTGRIERAKAAGTWVDYTKHYGEPAPQWHVVDARGVKTDVQISDFRGKWVLVDFWGLSCAPCLSQGIPRLMKFYEEHRAQRDRFEILAICIDEEGDLKSIADLDKKLKPLVEHVWGKPLPFPILLDPSFTTCERYGLSGLGAVVLIDPEGRLVKGDESVLAAKLKER
jgi:thiol-disulfide isomerase/thioredoxin